MEIILYSLVLHGRRKGNGLRKYPERLNVESSRFYYDAYLPSFMPSVPFPLSRQKGIIVEPEVGKGRNGILYKQ